MLKDKAGNRLFRKVTVRIVFPDAIFPPKLISQHAGPRQGYNGDGIDNILDQIADQLDTLYPWWEFKPVELAPEGRTARFVFKFAGYSKTPAPATGAATEGNLEITQPPSTDEPDLLVTSERKTK